MAISTVMTQIGMSMTVSTLYSSLVQYYVDRGSKYPRECAAGSIGGAVHNGFIQLTNGSYCRVR